MFRFLTLSFAFLAIFSPAIAQTNADFENINVPFIGFLNNAAPAAAFSSGNVALKNSFDANFQAWDGWAISKVTNNTLPGFTNQYSAITGGGFAGSANYAVGYAYNEAVVRLTGKAAGGVVNGLYVTNSTYAYFSMKDGDQFAKKFGGETGNDPDFLKLTVRKWLKGQLQPDSVDFYLADYRFANNAQDYLVKTWQYVDLRALGNADSLQFRLSSSDVGQFGMNTPAYFCADQIITADATVSAPVLPELSGFEVFPNPVSDYLTLTWDQDETAQLSLTNLAGQVVLFKDQIGSGGSVPVSHLPRGAYWLKVATTAGVAVRKIAVW